MNAWPFITAAYALTGVTTLALTGWCWAVMRRAERAAEALRRR